MAAIVATKYNPHVKALFERLLARGKSKMSALGACMRKLVHLCFGVLKTQKKYQGGVSKSLTEKTVSTQGAERCAKNLATETQWHIALRPRKQKELADTAHVRIIRRIEKLKVGARAKVEHPFHLIKNIFDPKKVHYHGLFKSTA